MDDKCLITQGRVYWITGLSGAGKTTVGERLYKKLREIRPNVIFLDGDVLREVFGGDLGYTREERYKSAMRNARLCQLLAVQGMDVICATISMFEDVRKWNRDNLQFYIEIYLKVSSDILRKRNPKGLYDVEEHNLVGFGVDMEEPKHPDFLFLNNGHLSIEDIVLQILLKS